jgi:predicted nucleotidyltransferase
MATEFEVQNAEEFEKLIKSRDFRVYEALVSTVLKNVISTDEDAVYDITIDKQDFHHTLEESLIAYEEEEKYEKCAEIKKAMDFLDKKKVEKELTSIMDSLAT